MLVAGLSIAPATTGHAQAPIQASIPLRTYSDDPMLADQILTQSWRAPEDGAFDVLALSGGGPNGAFGAGVLAGWTTRGDRPVFDHVTGVSTGALIAPFAYLGAEWDDEMRGAYLDERTAKLMQRRLLSGLFSSSMFAGKPLHDLVDSYVTQALVDAVARESRTSSRTLIIVTTDLDSQRAVAWDMGAVSQLGGERARKLFRDVLLASASIPGIFPPVSINLENGPELHVDGGVAAPIYAVPEALANRPGADLAIPAPVRLFMIANISLDPTPDRTQVHTLDIMRRSLTTSGKASMRSVLRMNAALAARYRAEFRVISIPFGQSVALTDFSPVSMTRLFELGRTNGEAGAWRSSVTDF
jgi:predicted acylesterase/phospholipase RssA